MKLLEAAKAIYAVLEHNGEWDEGCFYFNRHAAPELQGPLRDLDEAIAEEEARPPQAGLRPQGAGGEAVSDAPLSTDELKFIKACYEDGSCLSVPPKTVMSLVDEVRASRDEIAELKYERDEAVRSEALYREMFEENNRQRDELILENFKLKSARAEEASRMPGAKP